MSSKKDLLIEIGTEEMPPASLKRLGTAFRDNIRLLLEAQNLSFSGIRWFATPRRLALLIDQIDTVQDDIKQERRGPALDVAFDANGKPTKAAEGFARSCGIAIDELEDICTDNGGWLIYTSLVRGKQTAELIPGVVENALAKLPIARYMRWGNNEMEFVRPIKWLLFVLGSEAIKCNIMGIDSGNSSYGHRFHCPKAISITSANRYLEQLRTVGKVIADFNERRSVIQEQIQGLAETRHGKALINEGLLDKVTGLVEWPVAIIGEFDRDFLRLPREVLIATMQDHQKYFPVVDKQRELQPCFISIANIDSKQPDLIRQGNERVIRPRLVDAAFFWDRDLKAGLTSHIERLDNVIYQKQLGSLKDRMYRLQEHVNYLAPIIGVDIGKAKRAAELCLCDLLTEMVYEFPELQGTMGRYYAEAAGEDTDVCSALEAFYLPRSAGDKLPVNRIGKCLAIAEKIDSLLGIFAIGKAPTGAKDPFALRRAAIGLLRIIIAGELDINLRELLQHAATAFPKHVMASDFIDDILIFLQERLRRYYLDTGIDNLDIEAVMAVANERPLDFHQRLQAVTAFRELPAAESLVAANKRITNILKKSELTVTNEIDKSILKEKAEQRLATLLDEYRVKLMPLLKDHDYHAALLLLAGLRECVDNFFDSVMVMCEDRKIKQNRLALLQNLNKLFLDIADISKLQG